MRRSSRRRVRLAVAALLLTTSPLAAENALEKELGRNETRVWSAPYPLAADRSVLEMALDERLARLGFSASLSTRTDGRSNGLDADGDPVDLGEESLWLEPELLAESLGRERARRIPISLERLPEHVWRAVLAAEDARFFDHPGVDARSVARALWANIEAGGVAQGGSTITQQLIKNRDLSP